MRNIHLATILLLSILILSLFPSTTTVIAENDETEPSEINMYVDGDIPTVQTSNWTGINLVIVDRTGINWERFQERFSWQVKWLWPVTHPEWRRFLGYTTLKVEPSVGEGNPQGWHLKFNRSTLPDTTTGHRHKVKIQAMVDDTAVDYNIVVKIKCTRYDVFGQEMGVSYLYLPLKAMPLSNIKMAVDTVKKTAPPKSIIDLQLDITNNGNYIETFGFKIKSKNGLIANINIPAIVLDPKETKEIELTVLTPSMFIDFGTPRRIDIYAYSYETNETIPLGSITVVTQGIYISPLTLIIAIPILSIFLLIYIFYRYLEKRKQEVLGKPTKPWLIPEEREYLRELKEKDPEEYRKTLSMMKQEYKSAMLWYKSSIMGKHDGRISLLSRKKTLETRGGRLSTLKDILTREVEVSIPIRKEEVESKLKNIKEILTEEIPKEMIKLKDEKQLKKEKLMKKIQKQQEKQRRKLVSKVPSKM